ncbi:unnamed protein product, partial [Rotaria sordida]
MFDASIVESTICHKCTRCTSDWCRYPGSRQYEEGQECFFEIRYTYYGNKQIVDYVNAGALSDSSCYSFSTSSYAYLCCGQDYCNEDWLSEHIATPYI